MTFASLGRRSCCRYPLPALLLVLCGCSDLLFGLGEDPGEQLLVTRGSEILRVSVGSGDLEVLAQVDGSLRRRSVLANGRAVLHAILEKDGGARGVIGVDVCTGRSAYERPFPYPQVLQLSHDEDRLVVYNAEGFFEVPKVTVLSASTGDSVGKFAPLYPLSIHRISPGPAYSGGAFLAWGYREVVRGPQEARLYVLDWDFASVLDSIRGHDLGVAAIRGVLPDRDGRSIYIFSNRWIIQYDLADQKTVNVIPQQVPGRIATRSVLADGRILVTDLGYNLTPSSGNIYFISPDLQQVDTVDVGGLMGERYRATAAAVVDLDNQRAYVVSPDTWGRAGWGDPLPVRLLVLDLATEELVKVLDLGLFTRSPPLYFFPDCWGTF